MAVMLAAVPVRAASKAVPAGDGAVGAVVAAAAAAGDAGESRRTKPGGSGVGLRSVFSGNGSDSLLVGVTPWVYPLSSAEVVYGSGPFGSAPNPCAASLPFALPVASESFLMSPLLTDGSRLERRTAVMITVTMA